MESQLEDPITLNEDLDLADFKENSVFYKVLLVAYYSLYFMTG